MRTKIKRAKWKKGEKEEDEEECESKEKERRNEAWEKKRKTGENI
jgi:hypothetical protein